MRIAHIITRMIVGGAQENTLFTVRGHLEHGHATTLITGPTAGPEGKLLKVQQLPGLEVREVPNLVRALHPLKDWQVVDDLRRVLAEGRFDVVHTHSSKAGVVGRIAARRAGVPVVVHTVHGQAFHAYEKPWKNWLYIQAERYAARYCDRIYAVAEAMIDQCVAAGVAPREMYQTVYSGMDLSPYLECRPDPELAAKLGLPPGAPVVGKIARIFEHKGYEFLVEAAPGIVEAIPNVRFLIVGDGQLRPWLEGRVRELGLTEHFVFAGLVPPSEIPRYTALMDVLVHLSLREGLPRTVVQALASAKPAVGFRLDGTPEVIHDGETGYLCDAEDVAGVQRNVVALLSDPEHARVLGRNGREFVRERWDWHRMVDVLEAEYERLLAAKQTAPPTEGTA